tara:strand:- start:371 stop:580 length:210 start_codon:yes stop_codon:yes gene_type:complete
MAKFKCNTCNAKMELSIHTIKVVEGVVVSPEAMCCDTYMESIRSNKGFGTALMRYGGKVRGKSDGLRTN